MRIRAVAYMLFLLWNGTLSASHNALAATFTPLGYLPAGSLHSTANDVNRDGTVVVGRSNTPAGFEAFRWTRNGGMVGLGDLAGGDFNSDAWSVSDDGNTIVGLGTLGQYSLHDGFIWNANDGMQPVGSIGTDSSYSYATGVSANGNTVVGDSRGKGFIWDTETGIRAVSSADESTFLSRADDISGDGTTVVGERVVREQVLQHDRQEVRSSIHGPVKWSEQTGIVDLGALDVEDPWGYSHAVSYNGKYVVGSSGQSYWQAFRWSAAEGMRAIANTTIAEQSSATGVSDDGDRVVGFYRPPAELGWDFPSGLNGYAFLWTEDAGFRPLQEVLESDYALNLDGWILGSANAISGDGETIVGEGVSPSGERQAWVLHLAVPEPAAIQLTLLIISHPFIARRRVRNG